MINKYYFVIFLFLGFPTAAAAYAAAYTGRGYAGYPGILSYPAGSLPYGGVGRGVYPSYLPLAVHQLALLNLHALHQ